MDDLKKIREVVAEEMKPSAGPRDGRVLRYTSMWCEPCREAGVRWRVGFSGHYGRKMCSLGLGGGFNAEVRIGDADFALRFSPLGIIRNEAVFEASRLCPAGGPGLPIETPWLLTPAPEPDR